MKKKILFLVILLMVVCFVPNVLAVDIDGCKTVLNNVSIDARIPNTVHTIILAIQIAVPVVLVIVGMIDLFKAMTANKEDEIKKGQQMLVKRLITAALVFFVIAIVKMIVTFAAGNTEGENIMTCANCFLNGARDDGSCK